MGKIKPIRVERAATYGESLLVIIFMLVVVTGGYIAFNLEVELLMIIAAAFAAIVAYRLGISWEELEKAISDKLSKSMGAILIIWSIGIVIGAFMFCGSIPMVIYYGLQLIDPAYIYLFAFLTCMILSVVTGTSWGSAGTGGVAFMGVAMGLEVSLAITAGAVISGAVFGDKMSPLSETTNLSPLCAGAKLYDHIRSMCYTTIPAAIICSVIYFILGKNANITATGLPQEALDMVATLDELYSWNFVLIVPFIVIIIGAVMKMPPVPTMIVSAFSALIIGVAYQGFSAFEGFNAAVNGFNATMLTGGEEVTGTITTLLNRGGMKSMVGIIIMIFSGYAFAGIAARARFLEIVLEPLMKRIYSQGMLVLSTIFTSILVLACSGITYIPFIICGDMFKKKYFEKDLQPRVLSRVMEDSATCMAPLIPWGTSGLYYASVLGVSVYAVGGVEGYAPYAFLTFIVPVISIIFGFTGIAMFKMTAEEKEEVRKKIESSYLESKI